MSSFSLIERMYFEGVEWIKIFHHKMEKVEDAFDSLEEAAFSNSSNKFSILSAIDAKYKIRGKYEFLLKYPKLSGYNRWQQNNFPLYEQDTNGKKCAEGYKKIHIDWTSNSWCGLVKSMNHTGYKCIPSLIDGTVGSENWYYTIGRLKNCSGNSSSMPGPSEATYQKEVFLYVRNPHVITCNAKIYKNSLFDKILIIKILLINS